MYRGYPCDYLKFIPFIVADKKFPLVERMRVREKSDIYIFFNLDRVLFQIL